MSLEGVRSTPHQLASTIVQPTLDAEPTQRFAAPDGFPWWHASESAQLTSPPNPGRLVPINFAVGIICFDCGRAIGRRQASVERFLRARGMSMSSQPANATQEKGSPRSSDDLKER